jgi:hypothetical protein
MRAAATLLSASGSITGLADVVRAAGLADAPVDLDHTLRVAIGVDGVRRAEIAAGRGTLRVLLLHLHGDASRETLGRIARRLASRAPHVLWLVAAAGGDARTCALVAWTFAEHARRFACFLWETDRVVDSDAETLCALGSIRAEDDVLVHARCMEILGRDALTRRFYRSLRTQVSAIAATVPASIARADADALALLYASRLLFLCFVEAKGWLDGDRSFISTRFDECMRTGGGFHRRVVLPLFFGTLNTPPRRRAPAARSFGRVPFLNGGLFTRTPLERRAAEWRCPDERVGALLDQLFRRFRFVAREDSATWSEASIDPEMLGRSFESLMAASERRTTGVYYTPHELVSRVAEHGIASALPVPTLERARELRVLDPACGSGAFLVYVLERLARLRLDLGDPMPAAAIRRDVLARSVFGVDRNPTAVWLCELRLWLSVAIECDEPDPMRVPPLPNLDRNIRVGDALVGQGFTTDQFAVFGSRRIAALRTRYVRATGKRKQVLARQLDREERGRVLAQTDREIEATRHARRELLESQRARDLFGDRTRTSPETRRELRRLRDTLRTLRGERRRIADGGALQFSFGAFFADAQARGGFDVVLGNPPWVRLHRIPAALRLRFKREYEVYRSAQWEAGAVAARASRGFASQVDLAALFVERAVLLSRDNGAVSLLLPVKLWRSLAGGGVRQLLTRRAHVERVEDLSESPHAFDAAVYPSLVVARRTEISRGPTTIGIDARAGRREWTIAPGALPFDASPGAPWLLLAPETRRAFDRVRSAGIPLAATAFGAPRLGVKSGCNAAFVVRVVDERNGLATVVDADGETGSVEARVLRPALRGDAVTTWTRLPTSEAIVWTHDEHGAPLSELPPRTFSWLKRRYGELTARTDARGGKRWWSLFRVEAADCALPRVVWADIAMRPRALVLDAGDPTVPLNSCYVVRCATNEDAWALASLINSPLASAWLNVLAEPARGGYRRYLGWTVGQLPLPRDWPGARVGLTAAARKDDAALLTAALESYELCLDDVRALLEWTS